jgi:hypothetical protein
MHMAVTNVETNGSGVAPTQHRVCSVGRAWTLNLVWNKTPVSCWPPTSA